MENALKPEFWRGMSPEQKGATVRRLLEVFPWQRGKPFIAEPIATQP
jgi:hypothetical protein